MKNIPIVAKTKDSTGVVTEIKGECPQYDTVAEAEKGLGGAVKVLGIVNMHVKIRALDALRAGQAPPTLTKLFKTASPEAQKRIMALLEKEIGGATK